MHIYCLRRVKEEVDYMAIHFYGLSGHLQLHDCMKCFKIIILDIVMSSQIHMCQRSACLIPDRYGQEWCKQRAPFLLSDNYVMNEDGSYQIQRSIPMVNSFNKLVLISLMCNNDIKLIMNRSATNDLLFYLTNYTAKNNKVDHIISQHCWQRTGYFLKLCKEPEMQHN